MLDHVIVVGGQTLKNSKLYLWNIAPPDVGLPQQNKVPSVFNATHE